ncbi:TonB-dependent receptor [Cellvibrio japonicus]|nr:TonB-dependent receptor [Cellvibrio japonicus]QEI14985.1 TonB-dependent receptor [Cellvibrio japonicus]QEI18565.1 TonB-dependent receptor [Cellvibrio japonicus]
MRTWGSALYAGTRFRAAIMARKVFASIEFPNSRCFCRALLVRAVALLFAFSPLASAGSGDDIFNMSLAELAQVQISIATGNSTPLDRAPATASVITADDIRNMGARTLDEVLETVPGLHVSLSSLSRLDAVYSIRGIHTGFNPHVLLLLNGVPIQSSLQGSRPALLRLPITSIDRVEVIRGPGSAIYGADAYSGVINVITKDAAAVDVTRVGGRTGSFDSRELWVETAGRWGDVGIAFSSTYMTSNGDDERIVRADMQSTLDAVLGTQASLAPGALATSYEILNSHLALNTEKWQLNAWNWISRNAGLGAGGAQALDFRGNEDSQIWLLDSAYHFNTGIQGWDSSVSISHFDYGQDVTFILFPEGSRLPIGADGNINFDATNMVYFPDGVIGNPGGTVRESKIDWINIWNGWDNHRFRLALGMRRQAIDSEERKNYGPGVLDGTETEVSGQLVDVTRTPFVFIGDRARHIQYASIQDEWRLTSSLELTTGVRFDYYEDFGSTTNPRLALVWSASNELTTKLLYGSAFRAPSFSELGYQNNPVSIGNPNLHPEQIDTIELSFNYRLSRDMQSNLTLFYYEASGLIEFSQDIATQTKTARNARDQDGEGFEWELTWNPVANWWLNASYAYQNAHDKQTGFAIADAPGRQFLFSSRWDFLPRWCLHTQWNWVMDRQRQSDDVRSSIEDYNLLDFTLQREEILPQLDLSLSVRNAFNTDAREPSTYEIPDDYPLTGRSIWLTFNYRFQ